jgi:hypothetical protein
MLWRWPWPWGQHIEVSVLPNGKHQRPEGKLGAERELHVECSRCHGLPGRILSASPYLTRLYQCRVVRYLEYDRKKYDDVRSILRMKTASFRLVQALSWSNNPMSSFAVLCCGKSISCLPQMRCGLLLL